MTNSCRKQYDMCLKGGDRSDCNDLYLRCNYDGVTVDDACTIACEKLCVNSANSQCATQCLNKCKKENFSVNNSLGANKMSSVCDNQDDFNKAFRKAIKYNNKQNWKDGKPWAYVYLGLWLVFFIWAILLAMQVQDPRGRVIHLVFAIVASPVYVLAFYLGALSVPKGSVASMGYGHRW